jgi:hypothetical protein
MSTMDRFQILKGITPPLPIDPDLKESILVDIEIFGEEYTGSLFFLSKNHKRTAIEFSMSEKELEMNPRVIKKNLLHAKFHFHSPRPMVFYINVRNVITWRDENGCNQTHFRLEGPID